MKWMKRLRLINWHYFTDVTIEFGKQTLITGQNGAGKSTIIDALQVLFVADQRLIRFNAATDEAKRSYINYLKGKIGNDERSFLRDGDFTTYIVSEFLDEKKQESFIIGIAVDVYRDRTYDEEYFILAETRLEQLDFVNSRHELLNREEFHRRYGGASGTIGKRGVRNKALFERNKSNYLKALLARAGGLPERFFKVFTKALSFKPISDIRDFVYDYILDRRELQLDLLKHNFELHERYKLELERLQERKVQLQSIQESYRMYVRYRETAKEQDYVIRRLRLEIECEYKEQKERNLAHSQQQLALNVDNIALAETKRQEASEESKKAYQRWQDNAAEKRKKELELKVKEGQAKLEESRRLKQTYENQLLQEVELVGQLIGWSDNEYWILETQEKAANNKHQETLQCLLEIVRFSKLEEHEDEEWQKRLETIGGELSKWHQRLVVGESRLQEQLKADEEQIRELERVIRELEQKRRSYSEPVRQLKALLEERLNGRSEVWIFCEETELMDEEWRNAIEGYLNTQRFDILVEPNYVSEALRIYEQEKWKYKLEGVGLVDTEKEKRFLGTSEKGALAHEVEAIHPVIQAHVEHLLGRVMKAANEQELRRHRTAVTKSCMVYSNYVARQMAKKQYEVPYMGAKAIIRQLEIRRAELTELQEAHAHRRQLHSVFQTRMRLTKEKESQYARLAANTGLMRELDKLAFELEQDRNSLRTLDLTESERLKSEYGRWSKQEQEWLTKLGEYKERKGKLEEECKQGVASVHIQENKIRDAEESCHQWVNDWGLECEQRAVQRYEEAMKQTIPTAQKLQNYTSSWRGQQTLRDDQFKAVVTLRTRYNASSADIHDEENTVYDQLFETIEHLNIPEYQSKVEAARAESEEEFKSHFIFKLREAIEMARREFDQLNYALRHFPFSDDRYHFEVRANERYKKFYDAIMDPMLMEKGSLFELPESERTANLHELFEKLVRGEVGELDEFTDYRQYLDFDIVITSGNGAKSRFSQVLKEKSGGETQTPFYIAILASFHHLYSNNKTSRLVVFDEAFNKMDEQRIQSSLRLIKRLGLQLIAAVPDEKMQHMAPEVSTTLFVSKHNYQCYVDMIDRWEELDESETDKAHDITLDDDVDEISGAMDIAERQETLF
ncbi:ATP-binding protein [Paenibacillus glucanolyticus]|uniref:AAA family ATPase n=3 Tax=Paenibacillaceae TaxID=186822 RepID=A0A7Z2VST0_9BACL|nr:MULTISPECIES: SbcC/MukB-like Walker B domain-containing protein [Paenibacillaceae]MCK8487520.1 AAA family ATPase [Paenibacillus mellifer]MCT1400964.1 AAA family ATPase [Paenibacillus sp. p3-SID867]QJD88514.1 AAA family ATPase [Cohnella herbarum]